ncbi:hypothetical protein GG804_26350 [Sphingomonas histidinilytica]|uniref:hypothetical protein n=1 Tax=Rhizorhabdus histidinilytica TaxID=439228 RepID=UPI001ADC1F4A|nr:hypothetical protein [Rhizorhabdus histidinilytica]MBO9380291.1 hypothetical protein [Rhizorhabdus histidinilytica]
MSLPVETEHHRAPGPSTLTINLGDRQIRARHAHESGINLFEGDCGGCGEHHAMVTICFSLDSIAPPTRSIYLSFSAEQARNYAAALIDVANQLDGGGVRQ